jgi:hypothetical protein
VIPGQKPQAFLSPQLNCRLHNPLTHFSENKIDTWNLTQNFSSPKVDFIKHFFSVMTLGQYEVYGPLKVFSS